MGKFTYVVLNTENVRTIQEHIESIIVGKEFKCVVKSGEKHVGLVEVPFGAWGIDVRVELLEGDFCEVEDNRGSVI